MPEALTEARIAREIKKGLPEGKESIVLWSESMKGLGLRVRAGGAKTWVYMFRPRDAGRDAPPRQITLAVAHALSEAGERCCCCVGWRHRDEERSICRTSRGEVAREARSGSRARRLRSRDHAAWARPDEDHDEPAATRFSASHGAGDQYIDAQRPCRSDRRA